MPKLVRLYMLQVAIGFALSAVFVALLLWFDVANLGHLIGASDKGWIAVWMLFLANGIVFAGAQFAISVMRMQEPEEPPAGGRRAPVPPVAPSTPAAVPVAVPAVAGRRDRRDRAGV